jgi:hypothetical protein
MRAVVGIIGGTVAGFLTQIGVDVVTNLIYPAAISDMWDQRQVAEAMAARPQGALWMSVLSYLLGGLVGGLVGKAIWRRGMGAWVPALFLAAMALAIAFNFPVPTWTMFATFIAPLLGGLLANHLVKDRADPAAATTEA